MGRRRNRQSGRPGGSTCKTISEASGSSRDVSSESELENPMVERAAYGSIEGQLMMRDDADSITVAGVRAECRDGTEQPISPVCPGNGDQSDLPVTHRDHSEDWQAGSRQLAAPRGDTCETGNPKEHVEPSRQDPEATRADAGMGEIVSIMKIFLEQSRREMSESIQRMVGSLTSEIAQLRDEIKQTRQPDSLGRRRNVSSGMERITSTDRERNTEYYRARATRADAWDHQTTLEANLIGVTGTHQTSFSGHTNAYLDENSFGDQSYVNQNCNHANTPVHLPTQTFARRTDELNRELPSSLQKGHTKLPPFTGKESWKVWFSRFQVVAELEQWSKKKRLQELLPRLQGVAGEFVFGELPRELLNDYCKLVEELESRFRVVETRKTFEAKFNRRQQRAGESCEDFAADLKRLYEKAHEVRNPEMRRESLLRRFLNGLEDDKARFEVEYHKEPKDIDEAVHHTVSYMEARKRVGTSSPNTQNSRRRKSSQYPAPSSESGNTSDDESDDCRKKSEKQRRKGKFVRKVTFQNQSNKVNDKPAEKGQKDQEDIINQTKLDTILTKMKQMEENFESVKLLGVMSPLRSQYGNRRGDLESQNVPADVQCYACRNYGHISRNCPSTNFTGARGYQHNGNRNDYQRPNYRPHVAGSRGPQRNASQGNNIDLN